MTRNNLLKPDTMLFFGVTMIPVYRNVQWVEYMTCSTCGADTMHDIDTSDEKVGKYVCRRCGNVTRTYPRRS